MSYCRWSSDDFACDVYVYADVAGGWTTHVAGRRLVPAEPMPPPLSDVAEYVARQQKVREIVARSESVAIGLPHDDEMFYDPTPVACADRLEELRAIGYNVPQYAIDALRAEAAEDTERMRGTPPPWTRDDPRTLEEALYWFGAASGAVAVGADPGEIVVSAKHVARLIRAKNIQGSACAPRPRAR